MARWILTPHRFFAASALRFDGIMNIELDLDPFLWIAVCGTLSNEPNALRRVGVTLKAEFDYVIGVLSDRTCNFTSVFIVVVWPFGHGVLLWSAC